MDKITEQIIHGQVRDLHLAEPILYVDNQTRDRSGHVGHALVQTKSGRLLDFNANTSAYRFGGHAAFGWVEYRISEDLGETFGEIRKFPFSEEEFYKGIHTVSVEKAVCCEDGTILAFCLINSQKREASCEPWDIPMVIASHDEGETWEEPRPLCEYAGRTYDAMVKDGVVYALHHCNPAEKHFCEAGMPYRLYVSRDNGKTFEEQSVVDLPKEEALGYGTMVFTPEGDLRVFTYCLNDECNMAYAISKDNGKTWSETGKSYVAEKIRNPQMNLLDGQYILHGRSSSDYGFVLYTSADGLHWDGGHVLNRTNVSCYYSNNIVLEHPKKPGKKRMLIQYSESFQHKDGRKWSSTVNIMHLWVESVEK